MKKLLSGLPAAALLSASMLAPAHAGSLDYSYEYSGSANLSGMSAGSLRIGEFTDSRDAASSDSIVIDGEELAVEGGLAGLLQTAMANALEAAETPMSPDGGIAFNAEILEFSTEPVADGLQMTLRANVSVTQGGRTMWESALFSQGSSEYGEVDEALDGLLDRFTRELFRDDYFRMALGIF